MMQDIEPVMAALFAQIVAAGTIAFSGTGAANQPVLAVPAVPANLLVGLPVFGPGVPAGATVIAIDRQADMVTLSAPLEQAAAEAEFASGFLTTGRRVLHWNAVQSQPAFFLRRTGMTDGYAHDSTLGMTTLECEAWLYSKAGEDPNAAADAALTVLEQLLRASLAPDGDYGDPRCTLGGLVDWCRIEGQSDISPGDQGGQAIARVPIRVTLP